MKSQRLHLAALLGLAVATAAPAFSQSAVPNLISYQSRVADSAGVPLGNTTPVNRLVLFRIYDSPGATAPANRLYSEQQTVTIAGGEFSVLIGSGTAIATESSNAFSTLSAAVFGGSVRYLGVTVDDGDGNPFNDPEMSPRQQIVGTPFAFRAAVAEAVGAGGVTATALANASVGTAALAPAAVTADKLAANSVGSSQITSGAVGTGQLADGALTLAKHATDSIDSSKIVDGSIQLADLSPSARATFPKPSTVYTQGLGPFVKNTSYANHQFIVFPVDVSDLGVDGEVAVSYTGVARTGSLQTMVPSVFSGRVRILVPNFTGGTSGISGSPGSGGLTFANGGAPGVPADTATPFLAQHQGGNSDSNYSVTGVFNSTNMICTLVSPPTSTLPDFPSTAYFPRFATTFNFTWGYYSVQLNATFGGANSLLLDSPKTYSGGFSSNNGTYYVPSSGTSNIPLGHQNAYSLVSDTTPNPPTAGVTAQKIYNHIPLIHIFHYYPGQLTTTPTGGVPTSLDQANVSTNANAGGGPQSYSISSIVAGTNKLTITVTNPHVMQVGDTVTLSGVTGTPTANTALTVSAVPDRTSFEVTHTGAGPTYSGGTASHQGRYYKWRLWVAVHASVAARVTVSDY